MTEEVKQKIEEKTIVVLGKMTHWVIILEEDWTTCVRNRGRRLSKVFLKNKMHVMCFSVITAIS
jgi:hypothetical protein